MSLLLAFFLLALVTSFACSLWESVLLSITPTYAAEARSRGSATGRLLDQFTEDIDRPLAAILTLNTIAHTVGAIGVGAQANRLLGTGGVEILGVTVSFEALVAAVTTLAILVLSEIIPKTLGANYWRQLAPFTARSLKVLIVVLWPFVWLSETLTRYLRKEKDAPMFRHSEFLAMAEMGRQEGALDDAEARVIRNLLGFQRIRTREIMTPRTVLVAGERSQTVEAFLEELGEPVYSRLPVYERAIDTVTGIVLMDDLLAAMATGSGHRTLAELERDALFVPDSLSLPRLLRQMLKARQQLAVVVDEYGVTAGVVTMEDITETLLGLEIMDEKDAVADLQHLARERAAARRANPPQGNG
jgi:CBS domain containing-hemolysin-like protein